MNVEYWMWQSLTKSYFCTKNQWSKIGYNRSIIFDQVFIWLLLRSKNLETLCTFANFWTHLRVSLTLAHISHHASIDFYVRSVAHHQLFQVFTNGSEDWNKSRPNRIGAMQAQANSRWNWKRSRILHTWLGRKCQLPTESEQGSSNKSNQQVGYL